MDKPQLPIDGDGLNDHLEKAVLESRIEYLKEVAEARTKPNGKLTTKLFLFELTEGTYSMAFYRPDGACNIRLLGTTISKSRAPGYIARDREISLLEWPDADFECYTMDFAECAEALKRRTEGKFSDN